MHFISIFSSLLVVAAAAATKLVELEWLHEKSTGKTMLTIFNTETNEKIASSCGDKLNADIPISFNANSDGFGNFTVGDRTYSIHSNPEYSGGPSCSKKYNGNTAVVDCSGSEWNNSGLDAAGDSNQCLEDTIQHHYMRKPRTSGTVSARELPSPVVAARQEAPTPCDLPLFQLVGDGDPHQNY